MKLSRKNFAMAVFLFAISFSLNAMTEHKLKKDKPTPVERAKKQTNRMIEKIGLSEQQAVQVEQINLTFAEKISSLYDGEKVDKEAMKASREELKLERIAAMKRILTEEQFVTFSQMKGMGKRKGKGKKQCSDSCKGKVN